MQENENKAMSAEENQAAQAADETIKEKMPIEFTDEDGDGLPDIDIKEIPADESLDLATDENPKVFVASGKNEGEEIQRLLEEIGKIQSQHLRTLAEFDNFRKRTARETATIRENSENSILFSVLPIVDNLERGMETITDENAKAGMQLIHRDFLDTLEKLSVKEINPKGEAFNPELHNAIMHVEDAALGADMVSEVVAKGYMRGDKVIRYAMVVVAN